MEWRYSTVIMYHSRHCIGYISRGCWRNIYRQRSISTTSSSSLISKFDVAYHYPSIGLQYQSRALCCIGIPSSTISSSHLSINNRTNLLSSPTSRCFFSSPLSTVSNNTTKIYKYGCPNLKDRIQLSTLKPRQSAEIEDELYSRINNTTSSEGGSEDRRKGRLVDPILNKVISRNGLDWIKSVSVPSSLVFTNDRSSTTTNDNEIEESDSIIVTLQPPTLLHPRLDELSSNVAQVVQEEIVSLLSNDRQRYGTLFDKEMSDVRPDQVGVTVIISPQSTTAQSSTSSTSATLKSFTSQQQQTKESKALQNIKHFIAVYSCKGGVGKSTIATNLAYQLSSMGGKIGLLDVDVYGPSLPLLVNPEDVTVRQSPPDNESTSASNNDNDNTSIEMIEPIIHNNVKLMSLGYVSPTSGVPGSGLNSTSATVLRGPMAGRVVSQLLKGTNWGNLDVLVLDLPPGTGDVQLEICQSIQLSGAVAVSTPSKLAWSDVMKGVSMFGELNVRTLCVVENMSYFECEGGGRHYPFGKAKALGDDKNSEDDESGGGSLAEHYLPASSHVFHLPISSRVNDANDSGTPLCCVDDDNNTTEEEGGEERATFAKLANAISTDLLLLQHDQTPLSSRSSQQTDDSSGRKKTVLTVSITEAGEDTEFDVPFTQLSVDNESRNFTVRLFSNDGGYQKVVSGRELRCRDPRTGEVDEALVEISSVLHTSGGGCGSGKGSTTSPSSSSSSMVQHHTVNSNSDTNQHDGLFPVNLTKKGNYGYEVEWADGSKIIYSLLSIAMAAGGKAR